MSNANQQQQPVGQNPPGMGPAGNSLAGGANPQANGGQPDYSAQWAEYYRSVGKIKEAETIENQIKTKVRAC